MLDNEPDTNQTTLDVDATPPAPRTRRRAASRPAGPPSSSAPSSAAPTASALQPAISSIPDAVSDPFADRTPDPVVAEPDVEVPAAKKAAAKRPAAKRTAKKAVAEGEPEAPVRAPRKRAARKTAAAPAAESSADDLLAEDVALPIVTETPDPTDLPPTAADAATPLDEAPLEPVVVPDDQPEPPTPAETEAEPEQAETEPAEAESAVSETEELTEPAPEVVVAPVDEAAATDEAEPEADDEQTDDSGDDSGDEGGRRRRRRRGGRRRRRTGEGGGDADDSAEGDADASTSDDEPTAGAEQSEDSGDEAAAEGAEGDGTDEGDGQRRRRRRRRRRGEEASGAPDDPTEVVVRVREPRRARESKENNEITGISGSTRMEAKRQRRREGREAGRRRAPILSEAEFLARRESVTRRMVIRQRDDLSQIAVLEDDILVEHYVDRDSATSLIGNVYLGRVQNVLPSMEAAFIDIGRGRNAVLYAGEVDWDSFGAQGQNRKVEKVLKSGQTVLVQVSKDPVGAKGARLTNHVSIPGRYIVYAPSGHLSGISRKLPDNERRRLKDILAELVGEASVIVRTAAEGASEDELVRDVNRLKAQWADIEKKVVAGQSPQQLYGEPDLTVRIVRDLFTEDFAELVIDGNRGQNDAYDAVEGYVRHVAPHLADRLTRYEPVDGEDVFARYRLDEQIAKALERKVYLPSGGSLVIDRTEAMTVIDVNTGKFTGSGGNLEATVTSNNLEAAEEIVRQLRLRDIGGIIVIDFIDMVLPNNRELLLRRLVECLGRDRTRHQVAEVTSLGLVQMTRKKIGTGLLEAFTTECPHCHGRGVELHDLPVESQRQADGGAREARPRDQRRGGDHDNGHSGNGQSGNGRGGGAGGPKDGASDAAPAASEGEGRGRNRRGGRSRRGSGPGSDGEPSTGSDIADVGTGSAQPATAGASPADG